MQRKLHPLISRYVRPCFISGSNIFGKCRNIFSTNQSCFLQSSIPKFIIQVVDDVKNNRCPDPPVDPGSDGDQPSSGAEDKDDNSNSSAAVFAPIFVILLSLIRLFDVDGYACSHL